MLRIAKICNTAKRAKICDHFGKSKNSHNSVNMHENLKMVISPLICIKSQKRLKYVITTGKSKKSKNSHNSVNMHNIAKRAEICDHYLK